MRASGGRGAPPPTPARGETAERAAVVAAGPAALAGGDGPPRARRPWPVDERAVARGLLVLLAAVLPFEAPLFRLGPLQITSVELVLYAALAAWAVATAAAWIRHRLPRPGSPAARRAGAAAWDAAQSAWTSLRSEPMACAAALWLAALLASALAAPSYRAAALKFTLRSASGVLLLFAVRALARTPKAIRRVVFALLAGALLSAATALVELYAPGSARIWKFFREGSFDALGLPRASGVFGYPTIGAMYWEAAVPLMIVAPFARGELPKAAAARRCAIAVLGGALLVAAILASATRSGLAGSAVAAAALLVLGRRCGRGPRRAAAGVLAVIAALWGLALASASPDSLLGQRLKWWQDADWFRAEYRVGATPEAVSAGERFEVAVAVRNAGTLPWPAAGGRSVELGYHWQRIGGRATRSDFEGLRTSLPSDVPPGGASEVLARVRAPARPGMYRLRWDMVEEGILWFSERGNPTAEERIEVTPQVEGAPAPPPVDMRAAPVFRPVPPSRAALWRAAVVLWWRRPLLGIGPDNFRRMHQALLPPSPSGRPYTDTRIHANSLYFETLADLGLAGVAALAAIAAALAGLVRGHGAAGRSVSLGCGLGAAAFFVHGVLDYFFEFTPLFCLFWVLVGLSIAPGRGAEPPGSPS